MNNRAKLIETFFTHKIPMLRSAAKNLRGTEFYAILLASLILVGVFVLSPAISSLISSVVIRSNGSIAGPRQYVNALSGSAKDIQAAVDEVVAMGGGDVHIPEGIFNFIDVGAPWETVYVPPGVNIFGAGMVDENIVFDETDQTLNWRTILKLPYEYPTGVGDTAEQYEFFELRNPNKITDRGNRLSGFAIVGYRDELLAQGVDDMAYPFPTFVAIKIYGVVNYRIDHLLIRNAGGGGVFAHNDYMPECYGQGVIDHCKFINTAGWGTVGPRSFVDRTVGYGCYPRLNPNAGLEYWEYDISKVLGSYGRGSMYIEDCYFQRWRHCVASNVGAHYVFRHNRISQDCAYGSLDAHGTYVNIGTRAVEIYDNVIENPNPYDTVEVCRIRGGGGVIFNNVMRDYEGGVFLSADGSNPPECLVHDMWIWGNVYERIPIPFSASGIYKENVDYFLRPPSLAQDGFTYTPYPYPHPLTVEE